MAARRSEVRRSRSESLRSGNSPQAERDAASELFKAVDPDEHGNTEDRYLRALAPKLYRRGAANITSYGLKVFPTSECNKGGTLEFLRAY